MSNKNKTHVKQSVIEDDMLIDSIENIDDGDKEVDLTKKDFVITNSDRVNVRIMPSMDAKIQCVVSKDVHVEFISETEDWALIQTNDARRITGYVMKRFLKAL